MLISASQHGDQFQRFFLPTKYGAAMAFRKYAPSTWTCRERVPPYNLCHRMYTYPRIFAHVSISCVAHHRNAVMSSDMHQE